MYPTPRRTQRPPYCIVVLQPERVRRRGDPQCQRRPPTVQLSPQQAVWTAAPPRSIPLRLHRGRGGQSTRTVPYTKLRAALAHLSDKERSKCTDEIASQSGVVNGTSTFGLGERVEEVVVVVVERYTATRDPQWNCGHASHAALDTLFGVQGPVYVPSTIAATSQLQHVVRCCDGEVDWDEGPHKPDCAPLEVERPLAPRRLWSPDSDALYIPPPLTPALTPSRSDSAAVTTSSAHSSRIRRKPTSLQSLSRSLPLPPPLPLLLRSPSCEYRRLES